MAALLDRLDAEHVEDNDSTHLNVGTGSFTLTIWAAWTDLLNMLLAGKGNAGIGGIRYFLRANSDGTARAAVDDNVMAFLVNSSTGSLDDGVLRHFAMVVNKSDNTMKLYINGVEEGSVSIVGLGTLDSTVDFKIGVQGTANDIPLSGTVDDVRLYLRAMAIGELKCIVNQRGHDGIHGGETRYTLREKSPGNDIDRPLTVVDVTGNGNTAEGHGNGAARPDYAQSAQSFRRRLAR